MRPLLRMSLIGVVLSAAGIALALAIDWFPPQASSAAPEVDRLYDVLLVMSVPVFVLVMTVAGYSVFRFRAREGDMRDGEPIHGNTRLEVVWVTIPLLMVSGLAVYAWIVLDDIEAKQPDAMVVEVVARQFAWSYRYPQGSRGKKLDANELVLPRGRPVEFRIRTEDVIHGFWVPEFRLKSDAVPGVTTRIRITPTQLGRYEAVCAELCGLGHATMRGPVRVVTPAAFKTWLRRQGT